MNTYAEHYKECRANTDIKSNKDSVYSSVYDLTIDTDFLTADEEYHKLVGRLSKKIADKIDNDIGCCHRDVATYLNEWRDIEEITELTDLIMPQIEQNVFHCNAQIEFLMPYRNNFYEGAPEASWLWHYDDCPKEFIKFVAYLNETSEDSGCLQYVTGPGNSIPVLPTFREAPNKPVMKQYFAGSRIPSEALRSLHDQGAHSASLVGPPGTYALFTPNIIHRATSPKPNTTPREAIFFFIRPTLKKHASYINNDVHSILPERNVKQYELD